MAAALKVFCYSDGFHAWTVAASSRPKALAAWGVERDLFKDGSAKEIRSGPDYEAAREKPGTLIERGLSVDIGEVRSTVPKRASTKTANDRAKIERLEAELAALDQAQADEQADLETRRAELETEAAALGKRQMKEREQLKAKLKAARSKSD